MAGLKGLKKQRRVQVILLAFALLAVATGLVGYAMRDGINFFRSPSQIVSDPPRPGEVFRIGGLVEKGSLVRGQGETVSFSVTDTNKTIPVRFTGVLPDLFAEGAGMVGTGSMEGDTFVATEILAK
ncbi:cytochrome c maturation protein CcmE, partial [Salmonella enterica]|uniref:cytochrome c maturation protein CcmE n=1 Tax=Salmonella enterica TaxID=28901 RepID=UPI0035236D3C